MAEQDFYPAQGNRFRGSRYTNFTGGGINMQGNVGGVAPTTNPGLLETSSGNQSSGVSTNLTQMQSSNRSQPQIEVPSVGESLKNAAIGSALPYAGSTIGSTAGAAMAGGATFGEGISQGLTALGDKVGGFLGGGAAEAASSAAAGSTAAGAAGGGSAAASPAGSYISRASNTLTSGSTLGAAAGTGIGTAAATLLTGGDVEDAVKSGAGSAVGYAAGTALTLGNPIGGMIGGAIGGAVGGGSVICTELHRQGLISTEQLSLDTEFARLNLSMAVMRGYWFWANPYVRLMQKNSLAGRLATIFGLAVFKRRYKAICFASGVSTKFSMSGYLIRLIGEAMCYAIGCCIVDTPESRLKWKGI